MERMQREILELKGSRRGKVTSDEEPPPPSREPSPGLEYVSDADEPMYEDTPTVMHSNIHKVEPLDLDLIRPAEHSAAMDVEIHCYPHTPNLKPQSEDISSVGKTKPKPRAVSRSPSLEILDSPPTLGAHPRKEPKSVKKARSKTMQLSTNALGKRRANVVEDALPLVVKKFKRSTSSPADVSLAVHREKSSIPDESTKPIISRTTAEAVNAETQMDLVIPEQKSPSPNPSPPQPPPSLARPLHLVPSEREKNRRTLAHAPSPSQEANVPNAPPSDPIQSQGETRPQVNATVVAEPEGQPRPPFKWKENDAFILPDATIAQYLVDAPAYTIPNLPRRLLYVSRTFLSSVYGGSERTQIQYISPDQNPSLNPELPEDGSDGKRRLVFPVLKLNPMMPLSREKAESGQDGDMGVPRRVQVQSGREDDEGRILFAERFFKERWAREEMSRNKASKLDLADTIKAFSTGGKAVDIIVMQCVEYDSVFIKDIAAQKEKIDKAVLRRVTQSYHEEPPFSAAASTSDSTSSDSARKVDTASSSTDPMQQVSSKRPTNPALSFLEGLYARAPNAALALAGHVGRQNQLSLMRTAFYGAPSGQ
ncbi:hypothetical protein NMY22_g9771 [Coprinellus aureogranulatus]|nr:hypothetical protein NMY22_g9771 [Coprinellus aureogranulatus]